MVIEQQTLSTIFSAIAIIITVLSYKNVRRKDGETSVIAFAQLSAKVDLILQTVNELNDMKERVIKCEDSCKSAHHRIDEILGVKEK